MFVLDQHVSTQCVDYETCSCASSHVKRRVCAHFFWLTKTCLCVTFNIWHSVCHQISNSHSRNDVQPHDLTYEPFSLFNFSHTKSCARTLVWPTRRTVMHVHCEKTSIYATFWLTWTCPRVNLLIGRRVCIQVGYETCSCSCSHTKRRVCAHFFDLRSHVYA